MIYGLSVEMMEYTFAFEESGSSISTGFHEDVCAIQPVNLKPR